MPNFAKLDYVEIMHSLFFCVVKRNNLLVDNAVIEARISAQGSGVIRDRGKT